MERSGIRGSREKPPRIPLRSIRATIQACVIGLRRWHVIIKLQEMVLFPPGQKACDVGQVD
jgi:hypothetical protein